MTTTERKWGVRAGERGGRAGADCYNAEEAECSSPNVNLLLAMSHCD